jgi:transcriptional regulator with XRE-family HTH domain
MRESKFRERLEQEFDARRIKNLRYSLRAFAAFLATNHSTLSQILRSSRRIPVQQIRTWASKLGMSLEEADVYIAAESIPDQPTTQRQEELRHWTAEALVIVNARVHWEILRLCHTPGFQPDCRWIALQIGESVDNVNLALSRLLRLRLLEVSTTGEWKDRTGLPRLTEREFRKLALMRVRQSATELPADLPGA